MRVFWSLLVGLAACGARPDPDDRDGDGVVRAWDCDDLDPDVLGAQTWSPDHDGDGFGNPDRAVALCDRPEGGARFAEPDCADGDALRHPYAAEICDGLDQDCDGEVDEGASDALAWFPDHDGDGYGVVSARFYACEQPLGASDVGGDCDDRDADVFPDASEVCDGADDDCDGAADEDLPRLDWFYDYDGDGFGDGRFAVADCAPPGPDYVTASGDCDDADPAVFPGAEDVAWDGIDADCDGKDGGVG